jgi:glutathione S-transferase
MSETRYEQCITKTSISRYLGIPFNEVNHSFVQINSTLQEKCGRKTTVPTIEDGAEIVTDSWKIAEYVRTSLIAPIYTSIAR